jgi:hypothetical protein
MDALARPGLILGLTAILLALSAPDADARRGRARFSGRGLVRGSVPPTVPVLSREQLRECVALQTEVNRSADALDREEAALKEHAEQVRQLRAELDREMATVDRSNRPAIDAFNKKVERHRALVRQYNLRREPFQARADAQNQQIDTFNARCAAQAYYESDMQSVLADLTRVAK